MSKIFISYASKDREAADFIAQQLGARGADIFIDYQRLIGGEDFVERLATEIESSDAIVFLLSEHSASSKWVRKEIQYADHNEKLVVPVALDEVEVPRALFFLTTAQRISLTDWQTERQNSRGIVQLALTSQFARQPNFTARFPHKNQRHHSPKSGSA